MQKYTTPNPPNPSGSQSEYPKTFPFRRPSPEDILTAFGFGDYFKAPVLNLTMIGDNIKQTSGLIERTARAGSKFDQLLPAIVQRRAIAQRFFDVEEIHRSATIEQEGATVTGLSLVVLLCKKEPVDLVLGVGAQGQALVTDLRNVAAKMYPAHAQKFVTEAELAREAAGRSFAGEPDAFLLVALERLYKTKVAEYPSHA